MPLDKILGDLLSAPTSGKLSIDSIGGIGGLLKGRKKAKKFLGKNALGIGGAAAVAGVGFLAYKEWQESQQKGAGAGAPPPTGGTPPPLPGELEAAQTQSKTGVPVSGGTPPPLPDLPPVQAPVVGTEAERDKLAMKLVKAMIGAAHADGHVDQDEMSEILAAFDSGGLTAEEKAELTAALNAPPTVEDIAGFAESMEEGAELYAASLAAIDADTPAESVYLARLARQLELPGDLVERLHAVE